MHGATIQKKSSSLLDSASALLIFA